MRKTWLPFVSLAFLVALAMPALAARSWVVEGGTVTLALDDPHLATLGLVVVGDRTTASPGVAKERVAGTLRSFAVEPSGLRFASKGGVFQGFDGGAVEVPVRGGLGLAAKDGAASPVFLYDFRVSIDPTLGKDAVRLLTADSALPEPLDAENAGVMFQEAKNSLSVIYVDLLVSESLASSLGRPALAGQWIGTLEVDLDATTPDALDRHEAPSPIGKPSSSAPLDLRLGELYGIMSNGRSGTYPNGMNGLSAATTSCNTGSVEIPWNAPMAETHPFIGLSMFRLRNGALEQIGINWIKHGFFALSNNQCFLGCSPSDGSYMGIGCSDTYSSGNNASSFYLGPRKEVNPYNGAWERCGSFFDEPTSPDGDCNRNYNGEANLVSHRLEVHDSDLGLSGATYYYEGVYYVADDGLRDNNIGWRQCNTSWTGSSWSLGTVGAGNAPNQGLLVETWGDASQRATVAAFDGEVVLAVDVTDLGGGNWHYEYALYNWTSDRGVFSFAIPVGGAPVSNVGFHDIDKNAANDWTMSVADGFVTWATDDYAHDPNANALTYGRMYNFRFDTTVPPAALEGRSLAGQAQCGIFKPGEGASFFVNTEVPDASATAVLETRGAVSELALSAVEPNPFATSTRIAFTLPRSQNAKLSVIDVTGRTVRVLLDGVAPAGTRDVRWDGLDSSGRNVASGIYMLRLETAEGVRTAKVARLH